MENLNIISSQEINNLMEKLSPTLKFQVDVWTNRLYEVFNRRVNYQGVVW